MVAPDCAGPSFKILVIDDDISTASIIARALPRGVCEVIACRDMALAEAATGFTEFDLILVAPRTTGVDGAEGLAAADFLVARNPHAVAAMLVPREDGDLRWAVEQRGTFPVLSTPLLLEEVKELSERLDLRVLG
jgi:CheY-like chemotaxis protein